MPSHSTTPILYVVIVVITLPSGQTITAEHHPARGSPTGWSYIYAPGAGSNINDPFGRYLCDRLAAAGTDAYRFQFLYMEAGRRSPDRAPVLSAAWLSVIETVRPKAARLAMGGRSMGGRYASMVAASGAAVEALGLFAYPLHAPGDARWRDEHFATVQVPAFFCSGTNDAFATPEELKTAAGKLSNASLHFLEGADHGYGGRNRQKFYEEAVDAFLAWLGRL